MRTYNLTDLKNKTALITGASSGIGKAMAYHLAHEGVHLKLVARRLDMLKAIQSELSATYPNVTIEVLSLDINVENAIAILNKKGFCQVDILFNNAGLAIGKDFVGEQKEKDINLVLNTNLLSAIKITNAVLTHMKSIKEGDIIHLCSIAAHEAYPGGSIYCASKFGLRAFAKSLRQETAGQNIRVINISPGMVETEFSEVRFADKDKAKAVYERMTPLNADDIAFQSVISLKSPRHVNIDEIIIMASDQGNATTVKRT